MAAQESDEKYVAVDLTGDRWAQVDSDAFFKKHDTLSKILTEIKAKNEQWPLHHLYNGALHDYVYQMADYLIEKSSLTLDELSKNEFGIFNDMPGEVNAKNKYPLLLFEAFSIARSRLLLKSLKKSTHMTLLIPMWGEQNRMKPSSKDNPYGENFIREKIRQLTWLYKDLNHTWNIIFVDDGCPNKSGDLATELIKNDKNLAPLLEKGNISIEYLQDVIDKKLAQFSTLKSVNDSKKGGAVLYGFYLASKLKIQTKEKDHYVIFTDSDLSANVAQSGLLIYDLAKDGGNKNGKKMLTMGDRYGLGLYSKGFCYGAGGLNNYIVLKVREILLPNILPAVKGLADTQCGFKGLTISLAEEMVKNIQRYESIFDTEILLLTDKFHNDPKSDKNEAISRIGIVWLHSPHQVASSGRTDYTGEVFRAGYAYSHYKLIAQAIKIHHAWYEGKCDEKWVKWMENLTFERYHHICQVLFHRKNFNIESCLKYTATIEDFEKILKEPYPKDAPKNEIPPEKKK